MKKLGFICVMLLCVLSFVGCKAKDEKNIEKLYGTWVEEDDKVRTTYTFHEDGTFSEKVESLAVLDYTTYNDGTYEFDGKEIELHSEKYDYKYSYKVSFEDDTMVWANSMTELVYEKKE